MKPIRLAALLFLVSFAPASAAEPSVESAVKDWKKAVESASVENIMALYDPKAIMISTFVQEPMTTPDQIREYYKKAVANPDVKVEIVDVHPRRFGNVAVNSGRYNLSYEQEGEEIVIPARYSFVYVLSSGKWMIVDHHSSRIPMAQMKQ